MPRPFSLAHLTVIELDPPDAVSCAAAAGYDFADLRLEGVVSSDIAYPVFGDTPMRRELLRRLDDTGVCVFDIELLRLYKAIDFARFERLFETAARLGARRVKLACIEEDEGLAADLVAGAAAAVAPFALNVDLEFMPFSGIKTVASAARVVGASGAANAGVLVDALHLSRSGGVPADVAALAPALFAYVHLCDAPANIPPSLLAITEEARVARLIPGDGGLPLAELVAVMPPALPVSIELPMKEMAARLPALERARLALEGARRVVTRADEIRVKASDTSTRTGSALT